MNRSPHQYVDRKTSGIRNETFFGDAIVNALYSKNREKPGKLYRMLTSARVTDLMGFVAFDTPLGGVISGTSAFARKMGVDLSECLEPPSRLDTPRKVFERKIRYWETRPMKERQEEIASPADARMLAGSVCADSLLHIKEKFFSFTELIGSGKKKWIEAFADGDYAVFRLTPDKYHYNHLPVSGVVLDIYEIEGCYAPCNPGAVIAQAEPYSKNRRVVTVIDTDVANGTGAGLVAMIEIVALMIGDIVQCYSDRAYDFPRPVEPGMFVRKGQPKSLYRPGSSTDLLFFQKNRVRFSGDIIANMHRPGVQTRYAAGIGEPAVETEVTVRSGIGSARKSSGTDSELQGRYK